MNTTRPNAAKNLKTWMRRRFQPGWARGWDSTLRIELAGSQPFCADFMDNSLHLISCTGARPPLAVIHSDPDSLQKILCGALPLELAVMMNLLSTDNMTEVFKFVTVFKPDAHTIKIPLAAEPDSSPRTRLEMQSSQFINDFFSEWALRVTQDKAVIKHLKPGFPAARLAIKTSDPHLILLFRSGRTGINISTLKKTAHAHFRMPFASLHAILTGAQNLMIDLNFKQVAPDNFDDNERKLLELIMQLQPVASKIYRRLHADKGLHL